MADNKNKIVRCRCCLHAGLMQYSKHDPVLAECHKKPDADNERFPYQVEVANVPRMCPLYKWQDPEEKTVQMRAKRNRWIGIVYDTEAA